MEGCALKGGMDIVAGIGVKEKLWQNKFKNAYKEKSFSDPDFCVDIFAPTAGRGCLRYRLEDFEV